ncbi:17207_t:CDS:2 [Entrophospora sp. SA101]|nr:17207_t:CDS:2 [Entrophospora sp. SA101]CAJ0851385.1 4895_t:CDS:2 [Entrophospora sp. SA101]
MIGTIHPLVHARKFILNTVDPNTNKERLIGRINLSAYDAKFSH